METFQHKWQLAGRTRNSSDDFVRCEFAAVERFESKPAEGTTLSYTQKCMQFNMNVGIMFVEKNSKCVQSAPSLIFFSEEK